MDATAIGQKLRELSLSASSSCICVSSSEVGPVLSGWQTGNGCRAEFRRDRGCVTMKQVEKKASTGCVRISTPSKYKSTSQPHRNVTDKYHFRHHDSIYMFALEYRAVNTSAYRQLNGTEYRPLMAERKGECCCHQCPLVQTLPDMVQQSTSMMQQSTAIMMKQTQQLLDKLEQFAAHEKQMSLHVEWKIRNVSGRMRRFKMARTSPRITPESPQVVSQLGKSMRVVTYLKDQDPLSMKGRCSAAAANYPEWACGQSYNTCVVKPIVLVDYSHCIKPAPRTVAEKKSNHLLARGTPEMELKDHEAGRCVAMHQVMQSSWKRRPPLLERRKSGKALQLHKGKVQSTSPTLTIPKEIARDKVALYNIELSNQPSVSSAGSVAAGAKKKQLLESTQPVASLNPDSYRASLPLRSKQK